MTGEAPAKNWKILEPRARSGGRGRTLCVANQKGGVAKTTTTVNLAAALALRGHRVLVIDVDPQANATTGLGIDHREVKRSTYDLLAGGEPFGEVVSPGPLRNLDVVPSSLDLAGAEIELVGTIAREGKLAEAIAGHVDEYEMVFLDCPPSLGLLTINALAAAQDLIVPVQCEYYALEGLGQLLGTAERIRRALNPDLRIAGFLLTMFDARTKLSGQVVDDVRAHFGALVFETLIPRSVRISEAPSYGEPVVTLDPPSRGSVAYRRLAAEIEQRYGLEVHVPPAPPEREGSEGRAAMPGPGGRGYGTQTPEPPGIEGAWPRRAPWTAVG